MKREDFRAQAAAMDQEHRNRWKLLMATEGEDLDEDGYPTELALERIKAWHLSDKAGWIEFVHNLWHLAEWGWGEAEEDHDWKKGEKVRRFHVSTAGWSGNESLIRAMQDNRMLWSLVWVQARRGGHYIFEIDREIAE